MLGIPSGNSVPASFFIGGNNYSRAIV